MVKNKVTLILKISIMAVIVVTMGSGAGPLSGNSARAEDPHAHEHAEEVHPGKMDSDQDVHDTHGSEDIHEAEHSGENEAIIHLSAAQISEFGIQIAPAGPGKIDLNVELTGEVLADPDRLAHIVPRVSGFTRKVYKKTGDSIKAGDVLAVIESRELADIKAEFLTALKRLDLARKRYQREKRLWERKITSEQEFLDAETAMAEVEIQIYSAKQKLMALGFDSQYIDGLQDRPKTSLTRYEITSPIDGTIIQRHMAVGEVVDTESDIFTIADLASVWINLTLYQKHLGAVKPGQPVTIYADKIDAKATGTIDYVSPIVNESTRTATARVVMENTDGRWRPGLFVSGRVKASSIAVDIAVPKSAIQTIDGETVVFVETDHGFHVETVKIGRQNLNAVEIVSGIEPHTRIAVTQTFMLKAELNKDAIGGHHH